MTLKSLLLASSFSAFVAAASFFPTVLVHAETPDVIATPIAATQVKYGTIKVDGLNIAYREAGDPSLPKLVLLHGWPSSSHQYRNLIVALAPHFHVIAPDYQGFGNSDHPDPVTYHYSFEGISTTVEKFLAAKGFDHYGLFVQDYGGPVGFRVVGRNPKALDWLIIQNTNAYEEGF
jgi:pimeloyl-ACP methyl ester carboxylesterase